MEVSKTNARGISPGGLAPDNPPLYLRQTRHGKNLGSRALPVAPRLGGDQGAIFVYLDKVLGG